MDSSAARKATTPVRPRAPGGVEASQIRVLRLARPTPVSNSQKETGPDHHHRRFFAGPDQTLRPPAASGPGPPATESKPARQSIRKIMATNAHDPLAGPGKRPATTAPGRGPSGPTGTDPHRNHAANAPAVTWVGDITYIPTWQRGSPHLATVTGLHPARRIIGYTRGWSHAAPGPISQAPARGSQGLPTGPRRHSVSVPTEDPRTPRTGYAKIMADHEILPSVGRTGICHTQRGGRPLSTAP